MNMPQQQQQQQLPPTAAAAATAPATATAAPGAAASPRIAAAASTPKAASTPCGKASPKAARTWSEANGTPRSPAAGATTPASAATALVPRDSAGDASTGIENVMDELMAQYLRKRGYHVAPAHQNSSAPAGASPRSSTPGAAHMKQELAGRNSAKGVESSSAGSPVSVESTGRPRVSSDERRRFLGDDSDVLFNNSGSAADAPVTIEQYAQTLGLNTESCAANHILFYGITNGDPRTYESAYSQLMEWICNALDLYKYELHAVAYPMFVHCFLELVAKGYASHASVFLQRHARDHMRLHLSEIRHLSMVFSPAHVRTSEYAQQVLHSKFNIQLSLLSFELLNAFLSQAQLFLLLAILNERVNLIVTANQPGMQLEALDETFVPSATAIGTLEADTNGTNAATADIVDALDPNERASGYKTSDQVAQVVASSDKPNESEIGIPLTSGAYNVEYMVRAAGGGDGKTLEDLHAIKVHWGLLKPRRLHIDADGDGSSGGGAGSKDDDASGAGASGASGVNGVGSSGASSAGAGVDASGLNSGDNDKKGLGASGGGDAASGAAAGAKAGDKSAGGSKASDKSGTADAQRKLKRAKLSPETGDLKVSELEAMGPVPDRRSPFNAEIMEKLVLRQPAEMKIQELEDLRARASVSKAKLPSALCFTFLNPSVHINSMCFSDDATMVGAACADASVRVWRNDDQPLGTAKGSVYHGSSVDETDEDERTAILRGHSSAVYGASFSPDNRFALTGSADATVRLWSLASKSNLVTYRSHASFPVWDVQFGPYGYYFASCSMDRTARLWSTDHVTPLRVFAGHLSDVDCVQFHPNHNYLATGSSDKTVRLWDVQTGKCVRIFTGHFHGVSCLAFSRNGRYLASSGDDQYINIWDLQAGKRLETLVGHTAMVTSLAFSQESAVLASSGMDSTVRLWDMHALVEKAVVSATTTTSSSSSNAPVANTAGIARIPVATPGAARSGVKPVHIVRPHAMHELPTSRYLLKTLRSKQTPMYRVHYTARNLLLSGGVFQPKTES